MTTKTWVGGTGTALWSVAANWSPQGAPGAGDAVVIGAGASVALGSYSTGIFHAETAQVQSVQLTDSTTALSIYPRATLSASNGITLSTGLLMLGGTIQDTTLRLQGGTLRSDATPVTYDLETPAATVDGGIAFVGSTNGSAPAVIAAQDGPLTLGARLTLDVTGAALLAGTRVTAATAGLLSSFATINVAPGGSLGLQGNVTAFSGMGTASGGTGAIHIASGTLDISGAASPLPVGTVTFDDAGGALVLGSGQAVPVAGFRAGDAITVRGVGASGALTPDGGGALAVGSARLLLQGPTAPGATYAAAPDGAGGTLVTTTAQPAAVATFTDQSTGVAGSHALAAFDPASGPSYLRWQYIDIGSDTVAITAGVADVFLKGGGGSKALAAASGQNVLDGGAGSAFLAGGSGTDTFFVDVRGSSVTWDTLANFHAGDAVTVWGWSPGSGATERWDALDGAAGYQGATLRLANGQGGPVSSVTFAGLSADQAARLQMSTGTAGGLPYLYVHDPGV